jgi:hypothetical protein
MYAHYLLNSTGKNVTIIVTGKGKGNGKFLPRTGHEGPEGE